MRDRWAWENEIRMLYQAKDLTPEQKHAAEVLLGRPLSDEEAVSIKSVNPSLILASKLSPEERRRALRTLEERFQAASTRSAFDEDEERKVVDEALRATRQRYGPVH